MGYVVVAAASVSSSFSIIITIATNITIIIAG